MVRLRVRVTVRVTVRFFVVTRRAVCTAALRQEGRVGLGLDMYDFRARTSLGIEPGSVRILARSLGSLDQ